MLAAGAKRREDPTYRENMRLYMVEYRRTHPRKLKHLALTRDFGISVDDYERLLAAQGGVCAICGRGETRRHQVGKLMGLSVDHDHRTGRVRGILCSTCNLTLGKFEDDPARFRAAAAYLEEAL